MILRGEKLPLSASTFCQILTNIIIVAVLKNDYEHWCDSASDEFFRCTVQKVSSSIHVKIDLISNYIWHSRLGWMLWYNIFASTNDEYAS